MGDKGRNIQKVTTSHNHDLIIFIFLYD